MAESQSFKSHTRWFPPFHFFVLPVLLANVVVAGRHIYNDPTGTTVWAFIVAVAVFMLGLLARQMAVTVQDRVIRLEERVRMRSLLPADLQPQIGTLSRQQLVAVRFASDPEVEGIVRDILSGKLTTAKDIKTSVKNWRPDLLRA